MTHTFPSHIKLRLQQGFEEVLARQNYRVWTGFGDISKENQWLIEIMEQHLLGIREFIEVQCFLAPDRKYKDQPIPFVNIGYVDSYCMGATIGIDSYGVAHIGLNIGSVLLLYDAFNRIMSSPYLFPTIGNSAAEVEPKGSFQSIDSYDGPWVTPEAQSPLIYTYSRPTDSERCSYATFLAGNAVDTLVAHEFAHHRYGHVCFLNSRGMSYLELQNEVPLSNPQDMTIPCLEVSADSWAASNRFRVFCKTDDFTIVTLDQMRGYILMEYILFGIQGFFVSPKSSLFYKKHPCSALRMVWFGGIAFGRLDDAKNPIFRDSLSLSQIFADAEYAFRWLTAQSGGESSSTVLKRIASSEGKEALRLFREKFEDIRPQLEPFAYTALPPKEWVPQK